MKEIELRSSKIGMPMLVFTLLLSIGSVIAIVMGALWLEETGNPAIMVIGIVVASLHWILYCGLRVLKPQEAMVLTLFGNYLGTIKEPGFYWVNPFCSAVNPAGKTKLSQSGDVSNGGVSAGGLNLSLDGVTVSDDGGSSRRMSLKIMTLSNNKQKVNDCLGNPIEIGISVTWRIIDTAKAAFNVDNYKEFLSLQCDNALRNIVRIYPYDVAEGVDTTGDGVADEGSLRGSSEVVARRIRDEIQQRVNEAGIEAAMLQRQQARAIVDARTTIVDGAVGMVEMALERLEEKGVVELDEERKAAMVSNLLVVLCGNHEAQPIVNSGSLY